MSGLNRRFRWAAVAALLVLLLATAIMSQSQGVAQESSGERQGPATPAALGPAVPPEVTNNANDWPVPMQNYAAHRAAPNSPITSANVGNLTKAWTVPIKTSGAFGSLTSVPLVVGDTIYLQDMQSNVYAIDRTSGQVKWETQYNVPTEGPNGVAIGYGMLYGALGNNAEVFALDANTGQQVWRIKLSYNEGIGVDMVPTVYDNIVYVSTVPGTSKQFYQGGQKGILYALDAKTGQELWEFDTTTGNLWGNPRANSGGGLWYPPSIDDQGNIYFGVGNAAPWPGTKEYPNASSRPGDNDYASSIVSLDPKTGGIRWYQNAKPHDLFDLDFQLTPMIATVNINGKDTKIAIGSGKLGKVIAYNADTGDVLWTTPVGMHKNDDTQEIPEGKTIEVYPGPLGGTETPMAFADGTIYAPVVNLSAFYTSSNYDRSKFDYGKATGDLVAINAADGSVKWDAKVPTMLLGGAVVANDVVFTSGLDGIVRGFSTETGQQVWSYQAPAGVNAPLVIAGDMLLVPAGGFLFPSSNQSASAEATPAGSANTAAAATPAAATTPQPALIAFRLSSTGAATPAAVASPAMVASPVAPVATVAATPTAAASPAAIIGPSASPTVAVSPAAVASPAAAASPAAVASPAAATGATTIIMGQPTEFSFNPSNVTIPANTNVTVTLTNKGSTGHNFTIDALKISVDVDPGATKTVTINAPAGDYLFYCAIPGHREAGMVGTLLVK